MNHPLAKQPIDNHSYTMKFRSESIQIISFAVVLLLLVSILIPLITGLRYSHGIDERWQNARTHWHHALTAAVNGAEMEYEANTILKAPLESDNFQTLVLFNRSLDTLKDSLLFRLHRFSPPYSLKNVLEIEIVLDNITEELNGLSSQQRSSFESLLFLSYLLIALLLILYGVQSRQLASAQSEKSLAAELKRLSVKIYEDERKKIARDLHDGLSQNIALARMSVDTLPECNAKKQLRISLDQSFQDLRNLLFNLRTAEDFSGVLDELIERECGLFQERFGLEVAVSGSTSFRPTWNNVHFTQFFRILHEGLANIARHSDARGAEVSLDRRSGFVELSIRDNGRGMEKNEPGFGIKGMKERASLLGGSIEWKSIPGKGTEIHLSVPEDLS